MSKKKQKNTFIDTNPKEALGNDQIIDAAKSNTFLPSEKPEDKVTKRRKIWFLVLIPVVILLTILIGLAASSWWYVTAFEQAAHVSFSYLVSQVRDGWKRDLYTQDDSYNVLLLGLDEIKSQREGSLLTDTIMFISVNPNSQIKILSIPRDLWVDSLKTKVNALYYYGEESDKTTGVDLSTMVVEEILGKPVHHTVVIKLESVRNLVDALGGIDIYVNKTFEDHKFPREDADPTASDPAILYETIRFEEGWQHFNGNTALKYIRSRQSEDEEEGTDLARSRRQKQVIQAVFEKIQSKDIVINPAMMGAIYKLWNDEFRSGITEAEVVALAKQFLKIPPKIEPLEISVTHDEVEGVLVNPPLTKYKQWVYEPRTENWSEIHAWADKYL